MPFQIARVGKFTITFITFKRAFGVMSFCMTREIALHIEAGIIHLIFISEGDAVNCFRLLRLRPPGWSGYFITGIILAVFSVKVIRRADCSQCCLPANIVACLAVFSAGENCFRPADRVNAKVSNRRAFGFPRIHYSMTPAGLYQNIWLH